MALYNKVLLNNKKTPKSNIKYVGWCSATV